MIISEDRTVMTGRQLLEARGRTLPRTPKEGKGHSTGWEGLLMLKSPSFLGRGPSRLLPSALIPWRVLPLSPSWQSGRFQKWRV